MVCNIYYSWGYPKVYKTQQRQKRKLGKHKKKKIKTRSVTPPEKKSQKKIQIDLVSMKNGKTDVEPIVENNNNFDTNKSNSKDKTTVLQSYFIFEILKVCVFNRSKSLGDWVKNLKVIFWESLESEDAANLDILQDVLEVLQQQEDVLEKLDSTKDINAAVAAAGGGSYAVPKNGNYNLSSNFIIENKGDSNLNNNNGKQQYNDWFDGSSVAESIIGVINLYFFFMLFSSYILTKVFKAECSARNLGRKSQAIKLSYCETYRVSNNKPCQNVTFVPPPQAPSNCFSFWATRMTGVSKMA